MNNIGIGGILTFNPGNAVSQINAIARASNSLAGSQRGISGWASSLSAGLNTMGQGAMRAGLALAPLTAAFILGGREAAKFEQQMDVVRGVSGASAETMAKLSSTAKNLGLDFIFDPTTVGKGMEELARAGFDANETLSAVRGTMAAAAADGMELGQATEIVVNIIRSMGLEAKDAGKVSDVLALASARTTTDIKSLGSAMKYAASQAHTMKIPLEETVSMLALASDAGLKGTIGGTAFANTLRALAKPTKTGAKWMKEHNIQMSKNADGGLDVTKVFSQINKELETEGDVLKKSAILTQLFGRWGEKAFNAISKSMTALDKDGRPKIETLTEALKNANGAAAQIAEARLDNFLGTATRLVNIFKTGAIELWTGALDRSAKHLKVFADYAREIVRTIIQLNEGMNKADIMKTLGDPRLLAVAEGLRDGFNLVFDSIDRVVGKITEWSGMLADRLGPNGIYILTKFGVLLFAIGALLGPILLGFGTMLLVLAPIVSAIGSIAGAIGAVASALPAVMAIAGAAIGGVLALFGLLRYDGEKWYETIARVAYGIYGLMQWLMNEAIKPMANSFINFVGPAIMQIWAIATWFGGQFKAIFADAIGSVIIAIRQLMPVARMVFGVIMAVWGVTWRGAAVIFGGFVGGLLIQFKVIVTSFKLMLTAIMASLSIIGKVALAAAEATGQAKGSSFWADVAFFVSQDPAALLKPDGNANMGGGTAEFDKIGAGWGAAADSFKAMLDGRSDEAPTSPTSDIIASQRILQEKDREGVNVNLTDKRKLDINNCVTVDGRNLAIAQGRHQQEIHERAGFKATPWQRRQLLETGANPVGGLGGGL